MDSVSPISRSLLTRLQVGVERCETNTCVSSFSSARTVPRTG
ncbi:hypothetical protein [Lysobacter gummosus]